MTVLRLKKDLLPFLFLFSTPLIVPRGLLQEGREVNEPMKEGKECISCGEGIQKDRPPVRTAEGPLCRNCLERERSEPAATLIHGDGERGWIGPHTSSYRLEGKKPPVEISWQSIDPWRGYYSPTPAKGWSVLHSDNILAHSEDAGQLKEFDEELTAWLEERGIDYIKVFTRSSNVFSTGYELLVKEKFLTEAKVVAVLLALNYRDPGRYKSTALTGKDPEELTESDELFLDLVDRIENGEEPKQLIRDLPRG